MSTKNRNIIIEQDKKGFYFIPAESVPTASFIKYTAFLTGSNVLNPLFVSRSELVAASASFFIEEDPNDKLAIQFRIPTSSATGLTKEQLPIYISGSGRVGIGTNDPKVQFDIKTSDDEQAGTKLILRSGRGDNALQVGDSSGEIDFIIESGSFNDIQTSGSLASLRADAVSVGNSGATGKLVLSVAKDATLGALDIVDWTYAPFVMPGFVQSMSSSILIKDFSTSIRSRLEFQKPDNSFVYMSLQTGSIKGIGDVTMNGTGSFGLIEGGTF